MIEKFRLCIDEDKDLEVNLGIKVDLFNTVEEEIVLEYLYSQSKGIKWRNKGNEIVLFEKGQKISGYPSSDLKRVIVIYLNDKIKFCSPNNAVIYNANGSIHLQLKSPILISDIAKKRQQFHQSADFSLLHFEKVGWAQNSKGEIVTAITIGFDRDWREVRVLNTETGEFGECLGSSMR